MFHIFLLASQQTHVPAHISNQTPVNILILSQGIHLHQCQLMKLIRSDIINKQQPNNCFILTEIKIHLSDSSHSAILNL